MEKVVKEPPVHRLDYVSPQDLIKKADEFLFKYCPDLKIPIPIEDIVEISLRFKVLTIHELKKTFEIDSFICINQKNMIIDDSIFYSYENRSRFSYAHEMGHFWLHKDFWDFCKIKNIDDYLNFQNSITPDEKKRLEFQAHFFAGYVLLPQKLFRAEFNNLVEKYGNSDFLNINDFSILCQNVANRFKVSGETLLKQIQKEYPELYNKITKDT